MNIYQRAATAILNFCNDKVKGRLRPTTHRVVGKLPELGMSYGGQQRARHTDFDDVPDETVEQIARRAVEGNHHD